jgi:ATP-dependent Clp protease ATP-binding subunit ClpB
MQYWHTIIKMALLFALCSKRVLSFQMGVNPMIRARQQVFKRMSTNYPRGGIESLLNPNVYTEKAWGSINKLPEYAHKYGVQNMEPTHLLKVLMDEGAGGIASRIITKAGVNPVNFTKKLEEHLTKQPRVRDTSEPKISMALANCLSEAKVYKDEFGDQFVSTEVLLLAIADTEGYSKKIFGEEGSSFGQLKEAVKAIRGTHVVTSRTAEGKTT